MKWFKVGVGLASHLFSLLFGFLYYFVLTGLLFLTLNIDYSSGEPWEGVGSSVPTEDLSRAPSFYDGFERKGCPQADPVNGSEKHPLGPFGDERERLILQHKDCQEQGHQGGLQIADDGGLVPSWVLFRKLVIIVHVVPSVRLNEGDGRTGGGVQGVMEKNNND